MYGIQTNWIIAISPIRFENDVKMYGIQTFQRLKMLNISFENDVKMYGIQTMRLYHMHIYGLRMM